MIIHSLWFQWIVFGGGGGVSRFSRLRIFKRFISVAEDFFSFFEILWWILQSMSLIELALVMVLLRGQRCDASVALNDTRGLISLTLSFRFANATFNPFNSVFLFLFLFYLIFFMTTPSLSSALYDGPWFRLLFFQFFFFPSSYIIIFSEDVCVSTQQCKYETRSYNRVYNFWA